VVFHFLFLRECQTNKVTSAMKAAIAEAKLLSIVSPSESVCPV